MEPTSTDSKQARSAASCQRVEGIRPTRYISSRLEILAPAEDLWVATKV